MHGCWCVLKACAQCRVVDVEAPNAFLRWQVQTKLLMVIDVDLVPSHTLSHALSQPRVAKMLKQQAINKTAFIIPAFQLNPSVLQPQLGYTTASLGKVHALLPTAAYNLRCIIAFM